jgi:adenylate cyclase
MADIVGYTRLMGKNEEATLDAWYACRNDIIDPKIDYFRGRIVKHTGDGFLAEFPSAIDAMKCAIEMQTGLEKRNKNVPEESRILFRMGLNLCDIVADEEDIYGEGVNTAARVEALAEPGTICITSAVHDQVGSKVKAEFEDLGAKKLKNVSKHVRVFQVWPPENLNLHEDNE